VTAAGPDVRSMDGDMPDGRGGTVLAMLGSAACMAAMVGVAVLAVGGTRRRDTG
jgi:hypothetical protein